MKRFLKSPKVNAVCISLFTAFYASLFFITAANKDFSGGPRYQGASTFWSAWSGFLAGGHQIYIALGLILLSLLVVALLVMRPRPYDEYHTSILTNCLVVASLLTLTAIAVFFLMILWEPDGFVEKFTMFIVIHWATVVLANLAYVLLCRPRS